AEVPPNTCGVAACYEDQGDPDWLQFSVTINGITQSLLLGGNLSELIRSTDETLTGFDTLDFREEDVGVSFDQGITTFKFGVAAINLSEFNGGILAPGNSVPTNFSWPAAPGSGFGSGVFSITHEIIDGNLGTDTFLHSVSAQFNLTSASAHIVAVPEPPTASIFLVGLVLLMLPGLRSRSAHADEIAKDAARHSLSARRIAGLVGLQ
ncbi:MAG TPA: hypothetical protein VFT30_07280, partial [Nitrospira sp.]|nr:hypothetical protein [Nitrospira sp.]